VTQPTGERGISPPKSLIESIGTGNELPALLDSLLAVIAASIDRVGSG